MKNLVILSICVLLTACGSHKIAVNNSVNYTGQPVSRLTGQNVEVGVVFVNPALENGNPAVFRSDSKFGPQIQSAFTDALTKAGATGDQKALLRVTINRQVPGKDIVRVEQDLGENMATAVIPIAGAFIDRKYTLTVQWDATIELILGEKLYSKTYSVLEVGEAGYNRLSFGSDMDSVYDAAQKLYEKNRNEMIINFINDLNTNNLAIRERESKNI